MKTVFTFTGMILNAAFGAQESKIHLTSFRQTSSSGMVTVNLRNGD
jgi:hypothetical protein